MKAQRSVGGNGQTITPQQSGQEYRVLSSSEKLFGSFELKRDRQKLIQQTYLYLSVAVSASMLGGYLGAHSEAFLKVFFGSGFIGWIIILFALNAIPAMALKVARSNPRLAVPALALDGFFAGLVLAPLVYLAMQKAGDMSLVNSALVVTAAVFGAITFYVHASGAKFSAPKGMMLGFFATLCIAIPVNAFLIQSSTGSLIITAILGLFGSAILVYATSEILNDPEFNSPMAGALCLFAGLFNLFQAILFMFARRD